MIIIGGLFVLAALFFIWLILGRAATKNDGQASHNVYKASEIFLCNFCTTVFSSHKNG